MNFCYFMIISPWKRAWSFIWAIWIPLIQGCFVPSLVDINTMVLQIPSTYFCYFVNLKGVVFEQTWIPFTKGCFVPSLVEISPVVLEKKIKMWKVYRQTDDWTDDKRFLAFSSGVRTVKRLHKDHMATRICCDDGMVFSAKCPRSCVSERLLPFLCL